MREADVIEIIRRQFEHVSIERLVSGSGISLLYNSIAELEGRKVEPCSPGDITAMAMNQGNDIAEEAVSMLCGILGTAAGNLALTLGARGGVYIGGGIVPKLGEYFVRSPFRQRFEAHGRFSEYLARIPSFVIDAEYPALRGIAAALDRNTITLVLPAQNKDAVCSREEWVRKIAPGSCVCDSDALKYCARTCPVNTTRYQMNESGRRK